MMSTGKEAGAKITSRIVELLPEIFLSAPSSKEQYVKMFSKAKEGRIVRYIKRDYLQPNGYIDTYNVSVPESNGKGAFDSFSSPFVTGPLTGVADTFICIGMSKSEVEAKNLLKYIKTKFARAMLGIRKGTQHNSKETWEFVPMQDFSDHSDIDWSKSISEIDAQLYQKYGLSEEEIAFIESMIDPMG